MKMETFDEYKVKLLRGKVNHCKIDFDEYIKTIKRDTVLDIPEMLYKLHRQTRNSMENIGKQFIDFYKKDTEHITLYRTSEIFITLRTRGGRVEKRRLRFYPMHNHSYVSQFLVSSKYKPKNNETN